MPLTVHPVRVPVDHETRELSVVSQNDEREPAIPDNPQGHPEETVDALEERALGKRDDQQRDEPEDNSPAIEQDLDQEDMSAGGEDAGSEPSG